MIDGLRYDAAMRLPALRAIAERGVAAELRAEFPTFTHSAIATVATGVPPDYHGVRINLPGPTPTLDSIALRAADMGRAVRVRSDFEPFEHLLLLPDNAERTGDLATLEGLTFVYVGEVDAAGHLWGAGSARYHEAAANAVGVVEHIVSRLDPSRDAIVVLSDHGHLEGGGHGGLEPNATSAFLVAAGGPFAKGVTTHLDMSDVAPTLAVALGIDQPRHAIGRPALEMFEGVAAPTLVDDPRIATLESWQSRNERAAMIRTIVAALLLAVATIFAIRWWRLESKDVVPTVLFAAAFLGPYYLAGYRYSWSIPRGYAGFLAETLLFAVVGVVVAWVATSRRRPIEQAITSTILLGGPYALVSAYVGLDTAWLSGAASTWGVMLFSTLMFYGCLGLGAGAAVAYGYGRVTEASDVPVSTDGTFFPPVGETCEPDPTPPSTTSPRQR